MELGLLGVDPAVFEPGGASFTWSVPADATALWVEARWTCVLPVCLLAWNLTDPAGTATVQGTDSPLAWSPETLLPGTWSATVATGLAMPVAGEVRVTAFFEGDVPDGYTAFLA